MKKLYIFSYGLYPSQITLETLAAMCECEAVYTPCLDAETAGVFSKFLPGLKMMSRLDNRQIARDAVSGLEKHDTVGFLTYGNPLFLNQTAAEVMKAAAEKKVRVRIFSAVSSFDSLVNLFNLNKYSMSGLRLMDAASSVSCPVVFAPEMDTLVFEPDILNLPANARHKKAFLAAARKAYPASARVYLACCASISISYEKAEKGSVGGLAALFSRVNERHTMFIPAIKKHNQ